MHSWHISRVYLNGANVYDHEQTHLYRTAMNGSRRRPRTGVRSYENSRERRETNSLPKKEILMTQQSIAEVSSKECCSKNYLQPFPRGQIQAYCSQMYVNGGIYHQKSRLLDVHGQTRTDANGREMITLANHEVCPSTWYHIRGVSKATFYRYKERAKNEGKPEHHDNLEMKKPQTHTLQATATVRLLVENEVDTMPHKTITLKSREKVPSMVLPFGFHWKNKLPEINNINSTF